MPIAKNEPLVDTALRMLSERFFTRIYMSENPLTSYKEARSLLDYLQTDKPASDNWSIEVVKNGRSGLLHLVGQDVIAAQCGPLVGNGALLTLAGWQNLKVRRIAEKEGIRKNVSLSMADVQAELSRHPQPKENGSIDEIAFLKQAIIMVYQFQYKEAAAKLAEILRVNRYNYIAWLWYSRIVGKTESILKTLGEAQRWGNADREVLQENKRNRALLVAAPAAVKRCPICWTVLVDNPACCSYCKAQLKIHEGEFSKPASQDYIETAVTRLEKVQKFDPKNVHVAYCLALGYFNLDKIERALGFLRVAARYSPGVASYQQAVHILETLLARQESTASARPAAIQPARAASLPKAGQKSILVIEDSQTSRKVISMVLTREGYHVVEASTGADGIMLAGEVIPSLILLDIMLPDMTGFDVLPRLKDMPHLQQVPVIMLTGKTGSADRMLGIRAGSSEYLTKPFNPQKLIGIIKKYL